MNKLQELKNKFVEVKNEAQELLDQGKIEEAKAKMKEIKNLKEQIDIQNEIDLSEIKDLEAGAMMQMKEGITKNSADTIRAMVKKFTGQTMTEAENALLLPSEEHSNGVNGESYILPVDIRTRVVKKIREFRSLREVIGYMPVAALTGTFPVENFETVTGLVDFADGTDGVDSNDIKFTSVSFSLKEKAAFIKLSNTLLQLSDESLIEYVVNIFARKAVVTENAMIIAKLKEGKSPKALKTWQELKSSANVDLDPAAYNMGIYVTNQDGFDFLDKQLDTNNRPILQPDPTNSTKRLFNGKEVYVFSNSDLPTAENKVPIFYGALSEAIKFCDLSGLISFATSKEAGFMSNTTIARLIEFIDVIQVDKSDKCYIYGEFDVTPV